jgi:hypothetical protein
VPDGFDGKYCVTLTVPLGPFDVTNEPEWFTIADTPEAPPEGEE